MNPNPWQHLLDAAQRHMPILGSYTPAIDWLIIWLEWSLEENPCYMAELNSLFDERHKAILALEH